MHLIKIKKNSLTELGLTPPSMESFLGHFRLPCLHWFILPEENTRHKSWREGDGSATREEHIPEWSTRSMEKTVASLFLPTAAKRRDFLLYRAVSRLLDQRNDSIKVWVGDVRDVSWREAQERINETRVTRQRFSASGGGGVAAEAASCNKNVRRRTPIKMRKNNAIFALQFSLLWKHVLSFFFCLILLPKLFVYSTSIP